MGALSESGDYVTVLGVGAAFEGVFSFQGNVRIEGRLQGQIVAGGRLFLGEHGQIRAHVEVDELIIAGHLEGEVSARTRIELRETARVCGVLRTPRLVLFEGCLLDGRCEAGVLSKSP